jgi:pectate lyase
MKSKIWIVAAVLFFGFPGFGFAASVPAFPGAEGFGKNTAGGRGGKVIEVTNLNDSGAGSFRAAVLAKGPRTVVFRVGGTIQVSSTIKLGRAHSNLTIAGQTAPGGGICLRPPSSSGSPFKFDGTHDVIIRHMRFRAGACVSGQAGREAFSTIAGGLYNSIIDHCSFSWGVDETIGMAGDVRDLTVQWSIISEGLHCAGHPEGCHSNGLLFSGKDGRAKISGNLTVHHNLFAHNRRRNPRNASGGLLDAVNNVIYNYNEGIQGSDLLTVASEGDRPAQPNNILKNYFKSGANGGDGSDDWEVEVEFHSGKGFKYYLLGNIGPHRTSDTLAEDLVISPAGRPYIVGTRNPAPVVTETSAVQAFVDVLAGAGATLPSRDPVDSRVVSDTQNGTGSWINTENDVGGFPTLASGTAPSDTDHDGIPDEWESAHGLDPIKNDSAADRDGDGYTNVEEYINSH